MAINVILRHFTRNVRHDEHTAGAWRKANDWQKIIKRGGLINVAEEVALPLYLYYLFGVMTGRRTDNDI